VFHRFSVGYGRPIVPQHLIRARSALVALADVASMVALQGVDPAGGYLQVTQGRRSPPFEYHVWPSVAGTAWAVIVLRDDGSLWGAA
jgi:hypothetical protein